MEKWIKIISLFLSLHSIASFGDEVKAQFYVEELMLLTGPQDFVSYIDEVQSKSNINMANVFAPRSELSNEQSYYWIYFQGQEYLNELKKQVYNSFTSDELDKILKFYRKPVHAKFLVHFNTRARLSRFSERIQPEKFDDLKPTKDKEILTKNLLTIHQLQPLMDKEKTLLQKEIDRINQIYSVVKLSNNSYTERRLKNYTRYLNNYETIVMNYYLDSFSDFRKSEMRYLITMMKTNDLVQKYASIILSYHYFYLLKYRDIFKNKENLKKKLEEKENYRF